MHYRTKNTRTREHANSAVQSGYALLTSSGGAALLDFPTLTGPDGSNYDSKTNHFAVVFTDASVTMGLLLFSLLL